MFEDFGEGVLKCELLKMGFGGVLALLGIFSVAIWSILVKVTIIEAQRLKS